MIGGEGDDVLNGQAGDDVLRGGAANDVLAGGAGRDTFVYGSSDDVLPLSAPGNLEAITDFAPGEDRIDLRAFDAREDLDMQQHFIVVGSEFTTNWTGMGEIRLTRLPNLVTLVEADVNNDRTADFGFFVQCIGQQIMAGDFIL